MFFLYLNQKKNEYQYREQQREIAYRDASKKLEAWKQSDLELLKKQIFETTNKYFLVQFEKWKFNETNSIRQNAIQKSHSVISGKISEHLIPFFPNFPYNPKDARFIGSPIDLIIFDGMDEGQIKNLVFMEIKTGSSTLTTRERQIRDAVINLKVEWKELNSNFISKEENGAFIHNPIAQKEIQQEKIISDTDNSAEKVL
jgi:predicted Holliday junction resolvase-like endonuclease